MLVLTRKISETVVIDGKTEVRVLGIFGGKVKLGIIAPAEVRVDRKEVHDERSGSPAKVNAGAAS